MKEFYKTRCKSTLTKGTGKLTLARLAAVGLVAAGSEHARKKSRKAGEYSSGCDSGGHLSSTTEALENGGSVSAISQTVAPNDHTSILRGS